VGAMVGNGRSSALLQATAKFNKTKKLPKQRKEIHFLDMPLLYFFCKIIDHRKPG